MSAAGMAFARRRTSLWESTVTVRDSPPRAALRLAVKDAIDVAGFPTNAGSPAVARLARPARRDAAVVAVMRVRGARPIGKTVLTELCRFADGVNDLTGTPQNPIDPTRIPGGSSSGSAVAVATGAADVALGTDTLGSVRIPAACCGVVGLKPTRELLPLDGVLAVSRTLDTVGLLAATTRDLGRGMHAAGIAAPTAKELAAGASIGRLRLPGAVGPVEPSVDRAVDAALAMTGLTVHDVEVPEWAAAVEAAGVIVSAEGYAAQGWLLEHERFLSRRASEAIAAGSSLGADVVAYAREVAGLLLRRLTELFAHCEALALPTLPESPARLVDRGRADRYCVLTGPVNLAGLPALVLPIPGEGPMPASVQLVGPRRSEARLLAIARAIEDKAVVPAGRTSDSRPAGGDGGRRGHSGTRPEAAEVPAAVSGISAWI